MGWSISRFSGEEILEIALQMEDERYVGEYGDNVKSLVNSHIFKISEAEDLVKAIKNDRDILQFALRFEKDSIGIFQEFKNAANKTGAELIEQLIDEEKKHIRKIAALFQ